MALVLISGCVSLPGAETPPNTYPVQIYFGTDRAPISSENPGIDFGPDRGSISYGVIELNAWNATDKALPAETRADLKARTVETRLVQTSRLDADQFFTRLRSQGNTGTQGKVMLFVHGFKRNFSAAAENVTRLSEGIGYDGRTIFWSWPSLDNPGGYLTDRSSLQWSEAHLAKFISGLVEDGDTRELTLVAHSLGAEALTQVLIEHIGTQQLQDWAVIDNLVLLAPDIDLAIFKRDIAPSLRQAKIPTTIYVSSTDIALITSSSVNGYPRLGDASSKVYSFPGIDTIDVSRVAKKGLRHSYYRRSLSVIDDLHRLIIVDQKIDQRPGLKRVTRQDKHYWKMRE